MNKNKIKRGAIIALFLFVIISVSAFFSFRYWSSKEEPVYILGRRPVKTEDGIRWLKPCLPEERAGLKIGDIVYFSTGFTYGGDKYEYYVSGEILDADEYGYIRVGDDYEGSIRIKRTEVKEIVIR